jgi:RNA polymerase sigma-70 factor (ECF subfamily)
MRVMVTASKPALPRLLGKWRPGLAVVPVKAQAPTFEALYQAHFEFIWRSVRGLGVHPGFVDDLTQDVFVIAHRRLDSYEGTGSPRSWLFGIARRVCRDHRRSTQRKGPHVDIEDQQLRHDIDGDRKAASREALALVERFADGLDDEHREIFFLALIEGLSVAEVADTLGLNPNTTYSRVRVLRRDLARVLDLNPESGGSNELP